jgi:hypothetical protein
MAVRATFVGTGLVFAVLVGFGRAADDEASRALVAAAARGESARIAALLGSGADPNARDARGRPALVLAAASGRAEAVTALLRGGANPSTADRSGWSALHQAAESGAVEVARALLVAGAEADLRDRARGTPLDVAEQGGSADVARLLRVRGARGSGKSIGDTVCVRPWRGDGFCGVIEAADPTRYRLRVTGVVGCSGGCAADPSCSGGRTVGGPGGLGTGDELWVPASCLTHTGVR